MVEVRATCRGQTFIWTDHALQRWQQRFPGINRELEFAKSATVGKKQKARIAQLTPFNADRFMGNQFKGRYYLMGPSNIVFVVASNGPGNDAAVVTVFHLYGDNNANPE